MGFRHIKLISGAAVNRNCALLLFILSLLWAFAGGPVAAQDIQQLNPMGHEVYEPGTYVTGPCENTGRIPPDAGCGDAGSKRFAAVKLGTSGWSAAIGPPECKPVKLELEGRYYAFFNEHSSDWVGDKCYPSIGQVYFTESNRQIKVTEFSFEVGPDENACEARHQEWSDRIGDEGDAYHQALEDNLLKRASLASLKDQMQSDSGIVVRQAESQLWDIEDGLDMLRDDCLRIGHDLGDMCDAVADCGEDIASAIATGPGAFCLAIHEAFTGFRGGANSAQQAYGWFKRDAPCIAKLYDEDAFSDMIEALTLARQPLSGFSGTVSSGVATLPKR